MNTFEGNMDKTIADIAWQIFQDKMNISFIRPLTDEEKKPIVEEESYKFYIEEATKLYEKRVAGLKNVGKLPIIDVPASGKTCWMGGAFSLIFVYSKHNGNFILRGYAKECKEYLKKNYTHYFYNHTLWGGYNHRSIWGFWKKNVGVYEPPSHRERKRRGSKKQWVIREYSNSYDFNDEEDYEKKEREAIRLKRLPKRWIPEFDKF